MNIREELEELVKGWREHAASDTRDGTDEERQRDRWQKQAIASCAVALGEVAAGIPWGDAAVTDKGDGGLVDTVVHCAEETRARIEREFRTSRTGDGRCASKRLRKIADGVGRHAESAELASSLRLAASVLDAIDEA